MLDPVVARRIRLVGLDVDGVLTDNAVFLGAVNGERVEFKRFDVQDGLGIAVLRHSGLPVVWVSGRESEATTLRARELKIDEVIQDNSAQKLPLMTEMLQRRGLQWGELAFVGDDLADIPILRRAGLPIAVANAVAEVKALAVYVTEAPGGHGAVREVAEALLTARGGWATGLQEYLEARGDDGALTARTG